MKRLVLFLLLACDATAPCRSVEVGDELSSLPTYPFSDAQPPPASDFAESYWGHRNDFAKGPARDQHCCSLGDKCKASDCSLPENMNVKLYSLGEPYYFEYGFDQWQRCFVSGRDGKVTAIWSVEGS